MRRDAHQQERRNGPQGSREEAASRQLPAASKRKSKHRNHVASSKLAARSRRLAATKKANAPADPLAGALLAVMRRSSLPQHPDRYLRSRQESAFSNQ
jgi:hypothetical protein